jgi:hypothetical protein
MAPRIDVAQALAPRRDKPGHDDGLDFAAINPSKLLRGHPLPDMWDLSGKVAENCGKSRIDARQTRKLLRDRTEVSCGATALVLGWLIPTIGVVKLKEFTTLVRR